MGKGGTFCFVTGVLGFGGLSISVNLARDWLD